MRVSLFITCLGDLFYPQVVESMVRVLHRLGFKVDCPPGQTCCGQPALNSGSRDEAKAVAARMIHLFDKCDLVVSPSASCCAIVREHFPKLLADDPVMLDKAEQLASRTFEFVEFLQKRIKVDWSAWKLKYPATVTYHYSCHHREIDLSANETPNLLRKIDGIDYRPLRNVEECCGFGGTFSVKCGDISGAMVHDKVTAIKESGASLLVCNDAGCIMNIAGGLHREGIDVEIKHIAQILDAAMQHNHLPDTSRQSSTTVRTMGGEA